jgi:hypothetical protein
VREHLRDRDGARYAAVRQYSLAQILAVWAAAAGPEGRPRLDRRPLLEDQRRARRGAPFRGLLLPRILLIAYPSRRFQSAWMGIIVHSSQQVFGIIFVLTLVLA